MKSNGHPLDTFLLLIPMSDFRSDFPHLLLTEFPFNPFISLSIQTISSSSSTVLLSHSTTSQKGQPHLSLSNFAQGGISVYSRSSHRQGQPRRAVKCEQCNTPPASTPLSSTLNPLIVGCPVLAVSSTFPTTEQLQTHPH
jgi:hypothetical protein